MLGTMRVVLWAQVVLAVAALVFAGLALAGTADTSSTSRGMTVVGGAVVSGSTLVYGVLLIVLALLGLFAIRRQDRVWFLRAGIALLAPAVVAVASILSAGEEVVGVQGFVSTDAWAAIERTLAWLEWASWLILAAMVLSTLSAVLLLRLRLKTAS